MAEHDITTSTCTRDSHPCADNPNRPTHAAVPLVDLAQAVAENVRSMLPRRVRLDVRVDQTAAACTLGVSLEPAIRELLRNACEGMRRSGGVLTLAAGRPQRPYPNGVAHAADCVCITIGDTGMGMDSSTLEVVRRPDATSGGIARARRDIAAAGGTLDINSWPGGGTVVRVYLPAA